MVARKETPDILSDVLGGKPLSAPASRAPKASTTEYHNAGKPNPVKTEHFNTGKPATQQVLVELPRATADDEADKVKVTFYISSDAVESLESTWLSLRKLTKKRAKRSASKSGIVEEAIRMAAQDVADRGEQSRLVSALVKR